MNILILLAVLMTLPALSFSGEKYVAKLDPDGVQRIEVSGGGYFFRPDHIVVKLNTPVELTVKKEPSIVPHNFVMDEPEAGIDFSVRLSTEPERIRFTPARVGEYKFYCDRRLLFLKSHRVRGMEGTLEVVE